ncbi:tautomerase family protein [Kutzneria kofuensis]|uniref:4-oxalocrotonate tautomerase n=1 Tax=Kutzneria kofuensis TaxID=103725 RepID=A0A7W9KNM6_9PSEU|nr:4-oxalocrotonate tautomerase family protein [Kutzneria kofuensis]MBB5895889.1 4-oxalocrotonate tautomerase [Kutzneria kofuensis]
MPIVRISVAAGRTREQLRECMRAVHDAVRDSLGAPDASIRVLITEVDPELWSAGGQTLAKRGR